MIDIHSHIVFDVDDGPKSREESKALLTEAYRQGVRTIVSTSHRRKGMFETPEEKIAENFLQVREIAKEVASDLVIAYGAEIYYTPDVLDKLEKNRIPTLNNSRYALIEFSMNTPYRDIHSALIKILMLGITPVIAHIERYDALENNEKRVRELIDMGCYTQVNSSHVLKSKLFGERYKFMKKRAQYFLERDLVHVIASDMHNVDSRPPHMAEAYDLVSQKYGEAKAQELFIDNPRKIVMDQLILGEIMKEQNTIEIDVFQSLKTLWKYKLIILLVALVTGAGAFAYSTFIVKPEYTSTTRIYVVNRNQGDKPGLTNQDLQAGTYLVKDYREIILSQDVLEKVATNLKLDIPAKTLTSKVQVTVPADTRIVSISVKDKQPEEASRIANSLREVAAEKIIAVTRVSDVTTLEEARPATTPSSPNVRRNTLVGFLGGAAVTVITVLLIELLDTRVKRPEDVEDVLQMPLLGVVPDFDKMK